MEKCRTCPHRGFSYSGTTCPYHGLPSGYKFTQEKVNPFHYPILHQVTVEAEIWDRLGDLFHKNQIIVNAPFYLWMQNVADPNHLITIHPEFSSLFPAPKPFCIRFSIDLKLSSYRIAVNEDVVNKYRYRYGPILCDSVFLHITRYPHQSYTSFLGIFFSVERVYKKKNNTCLVQTDFYVRKNLKVPQRILDLATKANKKILEEDKKLVESWAPTARVTGNWLPGEERIRVYNHLLMEDGYI